MEQPTEDQLVARLKAGDSEAFAELYRRYRDRLFRFAVKLMQDQNLAQDVVQETFLRMGASIHTLDRSPSLAAWLFAIARNEVFAHFRRRRTNGQQIEADEIWAEKTPFDEVIGAESVEVVQRFIGRLKEEYREVLVLREYEGLSYGDIAMITGSSPASVKSRLFKARRALVRKLTPYFGEGKKSP